MPFIIKVCILFAFAFWKCTPKTKVGQVYWFQVGLETLWFDFDNSGLSYLA